MAYLAKEDSNNLKQNLDQLQNQKQLLKQRLASIELKKREKFREFEKKKSETNETIELKNKLLEELNRLRDESNLIEENSRRIEKNIKERRDCVQQLKTDLNERREHQSVIIDSLSSELDQMTQQFMNLALIHSCGQISDQIKEMDKEIKAKSEKLLLLQKEFDKLQEEFKTQLIETDPKPLSYKWNDWPIRERMIAYNIFIEENQSVNEELMALREYCDSISS